MLFISRSRFLTLSFCESCINSLTSPTLLLWMLHDHSHKYLYQLSSTCEQKPIGKKQHIYERNHVKLACEQAPGGVSAEQTFGAKRRAIGSYCPALAPSGACSQANVKSKWPTSFLKVFEKLVPRLSKMYAFLVPSRQTTFVKTTEHPWTKTILSRRGRRNCLIQI